MTIFDWLKEITSNKSKWESFTEEERASFNPYMMHRLLSMNPEVIKITIEVPFCLSDKLSDDNVL
jgi:hypothetical protein